MVEVQSLTGQKRGVIFAACGGPTAALSGVAGRLSELGAGRRRRREATASGPLAASRFARRRVGLVADVRRRLAVAGMVLIPPITSRGQAGLSVGLIGAGRLTLGGWVRAIADDGEGAAAASGHDLPG